MICNLPFFTNYQNCIIIVIGMHIDNTAQPAAVPNELAIKVHTFIYCDLESKYSHE